MGAYGLLEACGGIEGWAMSARAEAQVGMLTWYEAHVADRLWVPADSPGGMQITSLVSEKTACSLTHTSKPYC